MLYSSCSLYFCILLVSFWFVLVKLYICNILCDNIIKFCVKIIYYVILNCIIQYHNILSIIFTWRHIWMKMSVFVHPIPFFNVKQLVICCTIIWSYFMAQFILLPVLNSIEQYWVCAMAQSSIIVWANRVQ